MLGRLLDASAGKTYIVSANAGKVKIISDTEVNSDFLGELEAKVVGGIAVICLVGNNLITNFSAKLFIDITSIISEYPIEYFAFSADESINIAVPDAIADELYTKLHEYIVQE